MKILLLSVFILAGLTSCENKEDDFYIEPGNLLLGIWTFAEGYDNVSVYSRSPDFTDSRCYKFNGDGSMIERNILGWCATPPVTYENYNGKWDIDSDNSIRINVRYWGGITNYRLVIKSLTVDSLKIEYIYPGQ